MESEPPAWVLSDRLGEPRHQLRDWLRDQGVWLELAQADLIRNYRLRQLTCRLWPDRLPYHPTARGWARSWSRREIGALCAAALGDAEAKRASGSLRRRGVQR